MWKGGTMNMESSVIIICEMLFAFNDKGSGIWVLDIMSAMASCSH